MCGVTETRQNHRNRQKNQQTDRQTDRHIDRQTENSQTDRQTDKDIYFSRKDSKVVTLPQCRNRKLNLTSMQIYTFVYFYKTHQSQVLNGYLVTTSTVTHKTHISFFQRTLVWREVHPKSIKFNTHKKKQQQQPLQLAAP